MDQKKLDKLNKKIYEKALVDREHLLEFLTLIPTNDAQAIIKAVKGWLKKLNDDPKFDKVVFPTGDIDAVIGDLDSYGRVQPETILKFKDNPNKVLPIS